jgi:hypothetical protein
MAPRKLCIYIFLLPPSEANVISAFWTGVRHAANRRK